MKTQPKHTSSITIPCTGNGKISGKPFYSYLATFFLVSIPNSHAKSHIPSPKQQKMASLVYRRLFLPAQWRSGPYRTLVVGASLGNKTNAKADPVKQLFLDKLQEYKLKVGVRSRVPARQCSRGGTPSLYPPLPNLRSAVFVLNRVT